MGPAERGRRRSRHRSGGRHARTCRPRGRPGRASAFAGDTRLAAGIRRRVSLPRNARPTDGHRRRSSTTCSSRGRWIGCSAATSASARPKWRCGPRSKRSTAGYQVAVLVPTTILAEQHLPHVSRRGWPHFRSRSPRLSRFSTPAQQKRILDGADRRRGRHRHRHASAGPARRAVRQPGPVDHRRGAAVRRRGERAAQSPAADDRRADDDRHAHPAHAAPVAVGRARHLESGNAARRSPGRRNPRHAFRPELVRHAILRELNRGGQIFFVHNRVHDIEKVAGRLQQIVPEARIAHRPRPDARARVGTGDGRFRRIIASTCCWPPRSSKAGSTSPTPTRSSSTRPIVTAWPTCTSCAAASAATSTGPIAICWSTRTSISRPRPPGGCGRSKSSATWAPASPSPCAIWNCAAPATSWAPQQSGHIAVGRLRAVLRAAGTGRPPAEKDAARRNRSTSKSTCPAKPIMPRTYVPDMRLKIDLYRRLARVADQQELAEMAAELVDRFGPRPPEVEHMLARTRAALLAHGWQIDSIHLEDGFAVLRYTAAAANRAAGPNAGGRGCGSSTTAAHICRWRKELKEPERSVERLKCCCGWLSRLL